jgi:hypothetical protein
MPGSFIEAGSAFAKAWSDRRFHHAEALRLRAEIERHEREAAAGDAMIADHRAILIGRGSFSICRLSTTSSAVPVGVAPGGHID